MTENAEKAKKRNIDEALEQALFVRAVEQRRVEVVMSRKQRRDAALKQAREEHAKAFSQPLISHNTLTERERTEIRQRVLGSAQLNWRETGASMP